MYCVIQEVERKRKNQSGYSKELKSEYMQMSINGQDESHYWHHYSEECFERDIKKAYRITIHESYRGEWESEESSLGFVPLIIMTLLQTGFACMTGEIAK